jgi:hypothetical protein
MLVKTLYMATTGISPARTAAEIIELLVQAGATQIASDYTEGTLSGLAFVLPAGGRSLAHCYKLPVRIEPVFKILNGRRKRWRARDDNTTKDREQAERVAWRQLYRWVQAQLAMIEVGMAEAPEVFLPYMQAENGRSMYELFQDHEMKLLGAPAGAKSEAA